MKVRSTDFHSFVADGWERAASAAEAVIQPQVEAQYEEQYGPPVSAWERVRRWLRIRDEVQRRVDEIAPPDALY